MAIVFIAPQHRDLTGGVDRAQVPGGTLAQVIAALDERFPGLSARLRTADGLAPGLAASIDGSFTNRGLWAKVGEASEVHFLPAIGGG